MMSDVETGTLNMVVVKDLSRLGRNYIETGKLIEETFPENGVRFIAIGDDVDTDRENMDLDLMLPMKNIFNQYYPADVSRKTRQAFKTKATDSMAKPLAKDSRQMARPLNTQRFIRSFVILFADWN